MQLLHQLVCVFVFAYANCWFSGAAAHLGFCLLSVIKKILNLLTVSISRWQLLMTKKSPLVALTVLKKICDHPRLLSSKACHQLGVAEGLVYNK